MTDDEGANLRDETTGDGSGDSRRQAHAERERAHRIGTESIRPEPADPASPRRKRKTDDKDEADDEDDLGDEPDADDEGPSDDGSGGGKPTKKKQKKPDKPDGAKADGADAEAGHEPWSRTKKFTVFGTIALVMLLVAVGAFFYWLHARQFQYTDDAFIDAHYELVAPRVAGQVIKVHAEDNAFVESGQVLFEIDPSDYQVALDRAKAAVLQAEAQVAQNRATREFAVAGVAQAKAELELAEANAENADSQLRRYESLSKEAISAQQLDNLRTSARTAKAQVASAQTRVPSQTAQVDVAGGQISAADANLISTKKAQVQAELNLSYTTVRAVTGGRVTQRQLQTGDYVSVGQQLMILVPQDVYVTANYKETQITDMRPGQPVTIGIDAFPGVTFSGKVNSIQRGSGQVFSLLPPQNATGNYVKVVQRVPVKITFDDKAGADYERLGPGMSVTPSVRVR